MSDSRGENVYECDLDMHHNENTCDVDQSASDLQKDHVYEYALSPYPKLPHRQQVFCTGPCGDLGPAIRGETRQMAAPSESVYSKVLKDDRNMPL